MCCWGPGFPSSVRHSRKPFSRLCCVRAYASLQLLFRHPLSGALTPKLVVTKVLQTTLQPLSSHLALPGKSTLPIPNRRRRNPQIPGHKTRCQAHTQKPLPFLPELPPLRPELPFRQPQILRYLPLMDLQPGKDRIPRRVEIHVVPGFPPPEITGLRSRKVTMLNPAPNQPRMESRAIKPPPLRQGLPPHPSQASRQARQEETASRTVHGTESSSCCQSKPGVKQKRHLAPLRTRCPRLLGLRCERKPSHRLHPLTAVMPFG